MPGKDRPHAPISKSELENDATPARDRRRVTSRRNLEKAWAANRAHWEKTPARMAALRRSIKLAHAANRRRPRQLSPAQLDAARRNLANARAAMARRGRTPEHLAKLRETLKLAPPARARASTFTMPSCSATECLCARCAPPCGRWAKTPRASTSASAC
jgi:hypothetical protein